MYVVHHKLLPIASRLAHQQLQVNISIHIQGHQLKLFGYKHFVYQKFQTAASLNSKFQKLPKSILNSQVIKSSRFIFH